MDIVLKGRIVFFSILSLILFLLFIHINEINPSNDIRYFKYATIESMLIDDRGIIGTRQISITDSQTLEQMCRLVQNSDRVDLDTINTKANKGRCDLLIKFRDGDIKIVEISNTSFSGGIVSSGGLYYQNDSLRDAIINIIRSSSVSKRQ